MFTFCHKCGYSRTFSKFLKTFDEGLYREFVLEEMIASGRHQPEAEPLPAIKLSRELPKNPHEGIEPLLSLPTTHTVRRYVSSRAIPNFWEERLFYAPKFYEWAEKVHIGGFRNGKTQDEARLVIPFARAGFQGRALDPEAKVKYVSVMLNESEPFLFGADLINPENKIIAFEGPIDAMFVPNSVASGGSSIVRELDRLGIERNKFIICYDNEPRSRFTVEKMMRAVYAGYAVCVWPKSLKNKDVNDMILAGKEAIEIEYMIKDCAKYGLMAESSIEDWKKC